ncbi:MAG: hypothetical protein MI867_22130 [Pseudomonadales bacterium]|nr:hypothetical protein [Pseudomonadales bacterium]
MPSSFKAISAKHIALSISLLLPTLSWSSESVKVSSVSKLDTQDITVDSISKEKPAAPIKTSKPRKQLRDPSITYSWQDGSKYTGQWNYRDEPHGRGKLVTKTGDEYQGTFENGVFHGQGVYYHVNGDIYRGFWRKGKEHGQGVMTYKNGNIYEGKWANGLRHGKGVLSYRSGSRYEGDWKLGKRHGKGMFVSKSGQRYIGDYAFNKQHGRGVEVTSNGDSFTGTFSKGKKHGVGECAPRNGNVEVCLFDRGRQITNKKLIARAAEYFKKNRPTYEFEGGIGFLFEDQYTKQRRWITSEEVHWDSIEAMLSTQLRIRTKNPQQALSIVIDDYSGPGTYQLRQGKFLATIGNSDAIGLLEGERMVVEITSDHKGVIEGTFSASRLVSGEGREIRSYAIRNGQFEASKYVPKKKKIKDNRDLIKQKYQVQ